MGVACPPASTLFFMVLNYASSISIVFLNKIAYRAGFPSITLTLIHFAVTALGLKLCSLAGIFQPKQLRISDVLPLALAFCGFVVFTNLSLTYNTVGFYQLAKVMTTPVIVFVQFVFYKQTFALRILLSLLIVCIGVAQATNADVTTSTLGMFFATCGVLVTAFYQIWVKTKQTDLDVNAFQLLYYQAPLSALVLVVVVLVFENPWAEGGLASQALVDIPVIPVLMSAVVSFAVNLSIFLVIKSTSAITYNVLGHFKLCTVLAGGFVLFHDPINAMQGMGITITLFGIFFYSFFKLTEQQTPVLPTKQ
eukprot:m.107017 g.107017  ORF g.107017 m.107017 type:complete len:308 (+) comp13315_c0_seq7:299-1222(+)